MSDQDRSSDLSDKDEIASDSVIKEETVLKVKRTGEEDKKSPTSIFNYGIIFLVLILAVLIKSRVDILLSSNQSATSDDNSIVPLRRSESIKPKYVLYNANGKKEHLIHVENVLRRFGYEETPFNASSTDWTLMWAHDYPFNAIKTIDFKNLQPCQRVNHLPGCGYITNKVDLSTTRLKYIPRAFKLPQQKQELLDYAAENKDKLFVHKHNQHRHIRVRPLEEINFNDTDNFVQEFLDNPLLVDGFKFDIGVYTIITSLDPLRVHYYSGDILFRFCPVKYYPFDADNVDKYIVGDDYLPIWKVPSLSQYYNTQKHGMRESFNLYMQSKGRDPQRIWKQIEESIRLMMYEKERHLVDILKRYNYKDKRNFFELMRIDFVVDDDLNVFSEWPVIHLIYLSIISNDIFCTIVIEANMSPNLSAAHFPPNQLLYEQVLYNSLKMAGLAFPQQNGTCTGYVITHQDLF